MSEGFRDEDVWRLGTFAVELSYAGSGYNSMIILEEAAKAATSSIGLFCVASAMAKLQLHVEACEMFARALAVELKTTLGDAKAIDFIRAAPEKLKGCLRYQEASALRHSIKLMDATGDELLARHHVLANLPHVYEVTQESIDDANSVFEAMRPFRGRANAIVLDADNTTTPRQS